MKNKIFIGIAALAGLFISQSFTSNYQDEKKQETYTDLVCGMKVAANEAFSVKYKDKKYYFDSYNCKQSFEMNPEKFINKACAPADTTHKK